MSNNNKTPEEIYTELAIEGFVERAQSGNVSEYIKNAYALCGTRVSGISLQEFAARVSNWNPNKSGIGEKSQFIYLKANKFPGIEKLPNHGKGSMSLHRLSNGGYAILKGTKSNLDGIKSFDGFEITKDEFRLFFLKTIDIGFLSDNTGGGHQDNVRNEVMNFIAHACQQKFSFAGKAVKIYIVVDGRSASGIVAEGQKIASGSPHIVISESINL